MKERARVSERAVYIDDQAFPQTNKPTLMFFTPQFAQFELLHKTNIIVQDFWHIKRYGNERKQACNFIVIRLVLTNYVKITRAQITNPVKTQTYGENKLN